MLLATAVVGIASWIGILDTQYGQLTAIWPANGVLLAFVLTAPRRQWPAYLAAGFLGNSAVSLLTHESAHYALLVALANTIEVYLAALPFRKSAPQPPDLSRAGTLARFALFAGLVAPSVAAGFFVLTTQHLQLNYPFFVKFRHWFLGDSLGILLCVPLILPWLKPGWRQAFRWKRLMETIVLLSCSTLLSLVVCRSESLPFPFIEVVALVAVTFRLGLASSAVAVLLISFPASYYTFLGRGPLAHATPLDRGLYLQLYFMILLATVFVLSAVRSEEKRLADKLRSSEARYRALAETSQDLILRTTLEGIRTYVSPSVRGVTGWTEDELPPPANFSILIHPADRAHVVGFLAKLRQQPGSHTVVYRGKRRDGHYGWLEACVGTVFAGSEASNELVWTIRDISSRIQHEETLKSERQTAQELAWTDGLTGLSNRRAFDERLAAEWNFACQHEVPLSLLLLDVDHFKTYNDTYGHQSGDEALRRIAQVIGECTRASGDLAARYGGEEFVVVLPHADVSRAREVAERIREKVLELELAHLDSTYGFVTLSIGVSSASRAVEVDTETLIAAADGALYAAKRGGRNRISIAPAAFNSAPLSVPAPKPHSVPVASPHPV